MTSKAIRFLTSKPMICLSVLACASIMVTFTLPTYPPLYGLAEVLLFLWDAAVVLLSILATLAVFLLVIILCAICFDC